MKFATVLALAALAAGVLGVTAVSAQDPISARKDLMKGVGRQAGIVTKMVRGEDPYDAAKVTAAFDTWSDAAKKFGTLFPDNSKDGDTRAMPAVWTDRATFTAKLAAWDKDLADNRAKATSNLDGLKAAMAVLGKDCGGCHETFRKPQ